MNSEYPVERRKSLRSHELAVIEHGFFDIPPRTRRLLVVAGVCGIVIVTIASLMGNKPTTIQVDKILHFSGYFVLAFVLFLGLRPTWYIGALLALIGMGVLIEELQPLNGRTRDMEDAIANSIGVAVGSIAGMVLRMVFAYLRKEVTTASIRRRLQIYPAGATVIREGSMLSKFYIIKSGQVRLIKRIDGQSRELTTLDPGEVIGAMGVIRGTKQFATAEATQTTTLYGMDLSELMESAGGVEHPVSLVLATFADKMQLLIDRLEQLEGTAPPSSESE